MPNLITEWAQLPRPSQTVATRERCLLRVISGHGSGDEVGPLSASNGRIDQQAGSAYWSERLT